MTSLYCFCQERYCIILTTIFLSLDATFLIVVMIPALLPNSYFLRALNNSYQLWIDSYVNDDFARGVNAAIDIGDYYYTQVSSTLQQQMLETFATSPHGGVLF